MNNETENWKLNKIDLWINCVRSRECRICRFQKFNFNFFFFGGACPRTPLYNSYIWDWQYTCFSSDTSAVQLQKTPYLDKMNDDTEKQWSKIYIILYENRSLNTKETTQNKTKAAVKRATKNVQLVLQHCCRNSDVARFTTHVRPCLARNKVVRFFHVGGKTSNITVQLILQPCFKTNCALFVARFTVP